jgi:hypothetical protein
MGGIIGSMKFCQNCGLENADEAATCTGCKNALGGSGPAKKRRPTSALGEQDPPGAAGLMVDPNQWRQRSKRPLRSAPGARRHLLVPPFGEPLVLEPKVGTLVLGRDEECDIVIASPKVSRRHVEISFRDESPYVRDLGTMNGTLVNEKPVDGAQPLSDGDVLRFGDVMATYRVLEPGDSASNLRAAGAAAKRMNDTVPIKLGTLGGDLALLPMKELFAQLAKTKANGVLVVEGDEDGRVTFEDGAATEIQLGTKRSVAALEALQKLAKGSFRFDPK